VFGDNLLIRAYRLLIVRYGWEGLKQNHSSDTCLECFLDVQKLTSLAVSAKAQVFEI